MQSKKFSFFVSFYYSFYAFVHSHTSFADQNQSYTTPDCKLYFVKRMFTLSRRWDDIKHVLSADFLHGFASIIMCVLGKSGTENKNQWSAASILLWCSMHHGDILFIFFSMLAHSVLHMPTNLLDWSMWSFSIFQCQYLVASEWGKGRLYHMCTLYV